MKAGSSVQLSERHSAQLTFPLGILFAFIFCLFSDLFFLSLSFLQISGMPPPSPRPVLSSLPTAFSAPPFYQHLLLLSLLVLSHLDIIKHHLLLLSCLFSQISPPLLPLFMGSTCLSLASLPAGSPINLSPTHSSPGNLKLVLKKIQCSPPHK